MSCFALCGLPGTGKTAFATHQAIKHYKKQNNIIRRLLKKPNINNIYSNYPILLNKKKNIYSNKINILDLSYKNKFEKNSLIIIDEVQLYFDSDEFKDFPAHIAHFLQAHRHFDIKNIIFISQHPSRIVKKIRNVLCEYHKIHTLFKFPFLPFGFIRYTIYYEFEEYGQSTKIDKDMATYEFTKKFNFLMIKNSFNAYNSKYLCSINNAMPFFKKEPYTDKNMKAIDILNNQFKATQKQNINKVYNKK